MISQKSRYFFHFFWWFSWKSPFLTFIIRGNAHIGSRELLYICKTSFHFGFSCIDPEIRNSDILLTDEKSPVPDTVSHYRGAHYVKNPDFCICFIVWLSNWNIRLLFWTVLQPLLHRCRVSFSHRKNAGKEWLPVLNKIPDIYFYTLYGIWFVYLKFVNRKSDWFFSLLVSYLWFVWLKGPFWKMSFPVFLIFQIIWEKQRKDTGIAIVLFLFMDSEEIQFFSIVIMRRYFIAKWMDFFWIAIEYKHFPCIVNSWN